MAGDKDLFFILEKKEGDMVTFGDNGKEKIIGIGNIKIISIPLLKMYC